ncbi:hypothetical protein [Streptomyces yanii]|uniref:Uncharacterized protein n=1 Tax=Streptomyces yanii TaxID=78510 RepID=A0ABV5R264_9ACTN
MRSWAAQPAQAAEPQAVQAQAQTASADFPAGTLFEGRVGMDTGAETPADLRIKFSVMIEETPPRRLGHLQGSGVLAATR